jgi:urease accessory protein
MNLVRATNTEMEQTGLHPEGVEVPELTRGSPLEPGGSSESAVSPLGPNPAVPRESDVAPSVAPWLCSMLQASDSFYPTGSYAHSFGLEGLVQEGVIRDRETLHLFIRHAAIPALRCNDLPLAAHAWRAFRIPDWTRVGELCELSSAMKTAREARAASENIGHQRIELAATLRGSTLASEFLRRSTEHGWPCAAPVAAALEGHALGAPLEAILAGIYYTTVASLLAAAMKILRLGQNSAQSILTETLALSPAVIASAAATPIDEIGWFNPWVDIAAARHETADARMFIS